MSETTIAVALWRAARSLATIPCPPLLERMQTELLPFAVHQLQRPRFLFEQLDDLRRCRREFVSRCTHIPRRGRDFVKRLGQQRRKIIVLGVHRDLSATATRLPEFAGGCGSHLRANRK